MTEKERCELALYYEPGNPARFYRKYLLGDTANGAVYMTYRPRCSAIEMIGGRLVHDPLPDWITLHLPQRDFMREWWRKPTGEFEDARYHVKGDNDGL